MWHIWIERNQITFRDRKTSFNAFCELVHFVLCGRTPILSLFVIHVLFLINFDWMASPSPSSYPVVFFVNNIVMLFSNYVFAENLRFQVCILKFFSSSEANIDFVFFMVKWACCSLQIEVTRFQCHGAWSWRKSWRKDKKRLIRGSYLGRRSQYNGKLTILHSSSQGVTFNFCKPSQNFCCWFRCTIFLSMQTESEPAVQCLLDDLGLREKQQFVIVISFFMYDTI